MSATKDRITCHVLDTSTGKPARGVRVRLEGGLPTTGLPNATTTAASTSSSSLPATNHPGVDLKSFESQTDDDGRIKAWLAYGGSATTAGEVPTYTLEDVLTAASGAGAEATRWTLRFDTAAYFGGEDKTFFPEVAVSFVVKGSEGYHVPLLLAPYSYTTYRGS